MTAERLRDADRDRSDRIQRYLQRVGVTDPSAVVIPLADEASDRLYFRVVPPNGSSFVLAVYTGPIDYTTLPFVNVAQLFGQIGVPIPATLGHEADLGILALEDLGDVTVQAHVEAAPADSHTAIYRRAVGLIDLLQRRGQALASSAYLPYGLAFDVEKLTWELKFFLEHFLAAYRGAEISPGARRAICQEFRDLTEELAAEPRVLCHRDYHSRNLMLHQDRLYVLDFQDAQMGPCTYDLASLLKDSYVELKQQTVEELIAYFLELTRSHVSQTDFQRRFDMMCLQRTLKALGTFGYQATVRRNDLYVQYMPRTLRYVGEHLRRDARFGRLHELLATHLVELR